MEAPVHRAESNLLGHFLKGVHAEERAVAGQIGESSQTTNSCTGHWIERSAGIFDGEVIYCTHLRNGMNRKSYALMQTVHDFGLMMPKSHFKAIHHPILMVNTVHSQYRVLTSDLF